MQKNAKLRTDAKLGNSFQFSIWDAAESALALVQPALISFNSLFEMRWHSSAHSQYLDPADLSILYLRCGHRHIYCRLLRHANYLSILYLRCPTSEVSKPKPKCRYGMYFQFSIWDAEDYNLAEQIHGWYFLSILYLRCDNGQVPRGAGVPALFQFSIWDAALLGCSGSASPPAL